MLELPSVVPYFDLSLQHAVPGLLRSMKRWGSGERFARIIAGIRAEQPDAAFRSSFIVGFPGETERDHESLLGFLDEARLDWAGFFAFSREDCTAAAALSAEVPAPLMQERLRGCSGGQGPVTAPAPAALLGRESDGLVDG